MQVVLAVPHRDLRLALELYLAEEPGVFLVGVTTDAAGTRALTATAHLDLLLMSWDLPGCHPASFITELAAQRMAAGVIVLCADEVARAEALAAGASAAISSWDPPDRLADALAAARVLTRYTRPA